MPAPAGKVSARHMTDAAARDHEGVVAGLVPSGVRVMQPLHRFRDRELDRFIVCGYWLFADATQRDTFLSACNETAGAANPGSYLARWTEYDPATDGPINGRDRQSLVRVER